MKRAQIGIDRQQVAAVHRRNCGEAGRFTDRGTCRVTFADDQGPVFAIAYSEETTIDTPAVHEPFPAVRTDSLRGMQVAILVAQRKDEFITVLNKITVGSHLLLGEIGMILGWKTTGDQVLGVFYGFSGVFSGRRGAGILGITKSGFKRPVLSFGEGLVRSGMPFIGEVPFPTTKGRGRKAVILMQHVPGRGLFIIGGLEPVQLAVRHDLGCASQTAGG